VKRAKPDYLLENKGRTKFVACRSSALSDVENQTDRMHAVLAAHFCSVHLNRYIDGTVKSSAARGALLAVTSSVVIKKVQIADCL
jgi:hypothetical protein